MTSPGDIDIPAIRVQIKDKFCLTVNEAAAYFGIGEKKIRQLVSEHIDDGFVLQIGTKTLIKRLRFESFLNDTSSI